MSKADELRKKWKQKENELNRKVGGYLKEISEITERGKVLRIDELDGGMYKYYQDGTQEYIKGGNVMSVEVNPLLLQHLFYQVIDDLEYAQNQLCNDELSIQMKLHCDIQREEYINKFRKILKGNKAYIGSKG
jgi:hypothetical protein